MHLKREDARGRGTTAVKYEDQGFLGRKYYGEQERTSLPQQAVYGQIQWMRTSRD